MAPTVGHSTEGSELKVQSLDTMQHLSSSQVGKLPNFRSNRIASLIHLIVMSRTVVMRTNSAYTFVTISNPVFLNLGSAVPGES